MDFAVKYQTARERVLVALKNFDWTSWEVLRRVGGVRYSARLLELKRLGYEIEDVSHPSGDGKLYRLVSTIPGRPQAKHVKIFFEESDADLLTNGVVSSAAKAAAVNALRIFRANKHKL